MQALFWWLLAILLIFGGGTILLKVCGKDATADKFKLILVGALIGFAGAATQFVIYVVEHPPR